VNMASKVADMQAQLERVQGRSAGNSVKKEMAGPDRKEATNGREGKAHIGAYLDPAYRKSLRMVQAQTDRDFHQLLSEALNDLFRKYNVPVMD
jgi:hypothetical protein